MTEAEMDIQRLEAYLDGEVTGPARTVLEERLATDRALADQLDDLRAARLTRSAVWRALEPDERQVEHLVAGITAAARQREIWRKRAVALRWVSAAAASVLLGIGVGWFGRTFMHPQPAPPAFPVAHGPAMPDGPASPEALFRVALTDESGNVLAVQTFDSIDRARAFATDVQQWQQRQRQAQTGDILLVGDRF